MSSPPIPSQLPNASLETRGAIPHATAAFVKRATTNDPLGYRFLFASQGPVKLQDGRWLLAGSNGTAPNNKAEIMAADASSFAVTGDLNTERTEAYTTCLLGNGHVLLNGGNGAGGSTETFDPVTGVWTARATSFTTFQGGLIALDNGTALLFAGNNGVGAALTHAQIYDPVGDTWTDTGDLALPFGRDRFGVPQRIPGGTIGKVLVTGGTNPTNGGEASCEVYDGDAGTWALVTPMANVHYNHVNLSMPDGKVMVIAGLDGTNVPGNTVELYDPDSNSWASLAPLNFARTYHCACVLSDGRVVVFGGQGSEVGLPLPAELYDPNTNAWTIFSAGTTTDQQAVGFGLLEGSIGLSGVFGIGGYRDANLGATVEVLQPADPIAGTLSTKDVNSAANQVSLALGRVNALQQLKTLSLYGDTWSTVAPIPSEGNHAIAFSLVNAPQPAHFIGPRNMVMNGNFDFAQRGSVFTIAHNDLANVFTGQKTADRWAGSITSTEQDTTGHAFEFSVLQNANPNQPSRASRNYLKVEPTVFSLGNTILRFNQEIDRDKVLQLRGKTALLDFLWGRSFTLSGGSQVIHVKLYASNDPSDAATNFQNWASPSILIDHTKTPASVIFSAPGVFNRWSASGSSHAVVPNDTVALAVVIELEYFDSTVLGTYLTFTDFVLCDLAAVRDPNSQPVFSYSEGSKLAELIGCQRFFEKSYLLDVAPGSVDSRGAVAGVFASNGTLQYIGGGVSLNGGFKVEKRVQPALTIYSTNGAADSAFDGSSDVSVTLSGGYIDVPGYGTGNNGQPLQYQWTADAEFNPT